MARSTVPFVVAFAILAVGRAGGQDFEELTLIGPDHSVLAVVEGEKARVAISSDIDGLLLRPGAKITMVHNHPHGGGFSVEDLLQLAKPGVAAIVVIGADGSRYEASRAARYDADHFERVQFETAHDEVVGRLLAERAHDATLPDFDAQVAHLTSIALRKAGVLDYRATLAGARAAQWSAYRMVFGTITEGVAVRIRKAAVLRR